MKRPTGLVLIVALLATLPPFCFGSLAHAGRDGNPKECPLPVPTGERLPVSLEHECWQLAKALSGAPDSWKKPGATVRYPQFYESGDKVYAGFYQEPQPFMNYDSGRVNACEYIELWLPMDLPDYLVRHVLVHEYLHSIFFRFFISDDAFALEHGGYEGEEYENGGEAWVQELWPNPPDW